MRTRLGLLLLMGVFLVRAQEASLPMELREQQADASSAAKTVRKVEIKVMDIRTKENIPNFTIDFTSCGHPVYESNEEGLFSMEATEGFSCFIRIGKIGYADLDMMVDYQDLPESGKTYKVFLSRSPNCFSGHVRDTVDGNWYLPGALVELRSYRSKQVQRVETNKQGEFSLYLGTDSDYELSIQHPDYYPFYHRFSTDDVLDGREIRRFYLKRIGHKRVPAGLGSGVSVMKKDKSLEGINYYSVQVIAKEKGQIQLNGYSDLKLFGELYIDNESSVSKLKLGKFFDRATAEQTLDRVRRIEGYEDAFLTQYLAAHKDRMSKERRIVTRDNGYMVRLASYLNPEMFDRSKVEGIGTLTSIQKNQWTIMLIKGFDTISEAEVAVKMANERGFKSAHIVQFKGNHLEKIQSK